MKYSAFIIVLFCTVFNTYSQNVWFDDDFNDYSKGWAYSDTKDTRKEITNGVYKISIKDPSAGAWGFWNYSIFLDGSKDFSVETTIKQVSGVDNYSYGLAFGVKDIDNNYVFGISSSGYFTMFKYDKGTYTKIKDWEKSSAINGMNRQNTIKVTQEGRNWKFFVNGERVFSYPAERFFGNSVGFMTNHQMAIEVDKLTIRQNNVINLTPNLPKGIKKTSMGGNVNTRYEDISPVISPDGKSLYYGIKRSSENIGGTDDGEDAWLTTSEDGKSWSYRKNLGRPLNNSSPNVVISVMPDNNTMIMMHKYNSDGSYKSQGLSITHRTERGWSMPEDITIEDFYNNAKFNEFYISSDRKVLLMTVQRNDSYGNKDIYVSFAKGENAYSKPQNIGNVVNTIGDEISPFLAPDGVTLYYATDGKPGYGSHDVFVTRRLDNTWKNWSEPENLGPDINSVKWDAYYTVPASGKYAYMVSSENGIDGSSDLIQIEMPQVIRPKPVVIVYGKVLNAKTNEPIQTNVTYRDLGTDEELGLARSNATDGGYKIVLPQGKEYGFFATKQGFLSTSENFNAKDLTEYKEVEINLYLTPIEIGQTVRLNNIFFEPSSATLKSESFPELKRVAEFLAQSPNIVIEIDGHTDNGGSGVTTSYLMQLSQSRAKAVADYIIKSGVNSSQVQYKGFGNTKPIGDNNTSDGRAKNRRVEFTVLKK